VLLEWFWLCRAASAGVCACTSEALTSSASTAEIKEIRRIIVVMVCLLPSGEREIAAPQRLAHANAMLPECISATSLARKFQSLQVSAGQVLLVISTLDYRPAVILWRG
jgi:hypothetical protein